MKTKLRGRLLTLLMAIILCLPMIPTTVFAENNVADFGATMAGFKEGNKISDIELTPISEGYTATVNSVRKADHSWLSKDNLGAQMTDTETFQEGKHYLFFITYKAKDGYKLVSNGLNADQEYANITFNGEPMIYWDGNANQGFRFLQKKSVRVPEKPKYTVRFAVDGGSTVDEQTVKEGEKAMKPADDPTKEGHTFAGWYADAFKSVAFDFNSAITRNTTIYAKWVPTPKHTLTFETDGGSPVPNQEVAHAQKAQEPVAPTKDGYTFAGWYTEAECVNAYDFNALVTGNLTLYAKWAQNPAPAVNYTITFDANGHGVAPEAQTIVENGQVALPSAPEAEGYTFGGWYTEAECVNAYDFSAPVTGNLTLYAKWTQKDSTNVVVPGKENKKTDEKSKAQSKEKSTTHLPKAGAIIQSNAMVFMFSIIAIAAGSAMMYTKKEK
ncbi:InlB B-repeat-containing protein [Allofustis seminis]|uniref:InlB B-repeat-containing protein n=1 Tax=Allofustis seminis TaxID=166939 RepID=UPI0003747623|nr:InlB B-repeat-containing protein [Allofustis seminis]